MPSTSTSVIDATAAWSWSIPEFAASEADRSAVLRAMGRSVIEKAGQPTHQPSGATVPALGLVPRETRMLRCAEHAPRV
jgi:hypothetical protein